MASQLNYLRKSQKECMGLFNKEKTLQTNKFVITEKSPFGKDEKEVAKL